MPLFRIDFICFLFYSIFSATANSGEAQSGRRFWCRTFQCRMGSIHGIGNHHSLGLLLPQFTQIVKMHLGPGPEKIPGEGVCRKIPFGKKQLLLNNYGFFLKMKISLNEFVLFFSIEVKQKVPLFVLSAVSRGFSSLSSLPPGTDLECIPKSFKVAHVVDNVLGIVTNTIDQATNFCHIFYLFVNQNLTSQMLMDNYRCTTLMRYLNTIGQVSVVKRAMGGIPMPCHFPPIRLSSFSSHNSSLLSSDCPQLHVGDR